MATTDWTGVIPAITTPFRDDDTIDLAFLAEHAAWMIDAGCTGVVSPGSLGEGAALSGGEKREIWRALVAAVGIRVPVVAAIAAASTREAVALASAAHSCGCAALMVLPPQLHRGSWEELRGHLSAVFDATPLPCMLYNNPIAYGTDVLPWQVAALAGDCANLGAVKESSADVRRITAIRHLLGDRLAILVGVDDLLVEGVDAGAVGWIAGLVNALPHESVRLFQLSMAAAGGDATARSAVDELYRWFLPLLRMDVVPEFVHLIKLCQASVGRGSPRLRAPRRELEGAALAAAQATIAEALLTRPWPSGVDPTD